MINVKPIGGGSDDLPKKGGIIADVMRTSIQRVVLLLQARVKLKLTDDVLKVRTGRLRRSITSEVVEEQGQIVGRVGTNVVYAAPHEFGLNKDQQVREHMRKAKMVFGKMLKEPITVHVRAHTRHMVIPERSFLRSALLEMRDEIPKQLQADVSKV